jgi:ribosome-associated translation inhibitor RaiA
MQIPLQIAFEHVDHSDSIESHVRKAAGKLEQFYDGITSARVVIGKPQHRHHKGDTYVVRLHLTIPGAADIAVSRDPAATGRHEDLEVTLHDAFDASRRELQDLVRRRQGHVKLHKAPPH